MMLILDFLNKQNNKSNSLFVLQNNFAYVPVLLPYQIDMNNK